MAPSAFEVLAELDTDGLLRQSEGVLLGGEMLRPAAYTELIGTGSRLVNSYGPTEASVTCPPYELDLLHRAPSRGRSRSAPRSRCPVPTCSTTRLRPVPPG